MIEFDLSGQCDSGRNRQLQAWSQNMYEGADEGDHPAPSTLRVIVSAQQPFRLHLRVVFRLDSRDVAFVYAVFVDSHRVILLLLLLRGRVVVVGDDRAASFARPVQQRPGPRAGYRHHGLEDDFFRGYVPVSLPILLFVCTVFVLVARIGAARDRARFIRNMLPIVSRAYVLPMRFFLATTARQRLPTCRRAKRICYTLDTVSRISGSWKLPLFSRCSFFPANLIAIVSGSQLLESTILGNEGLTVNL